jgi:hypothetical protein
VVDGRQGCHNHQTDSDSERQRLLEHADQQRTRKN